MAESASETIPQRETMLSSQSPLEVVLNILSFLPHADLSSLLLLNRSYHKLVLPLTWQRIVKEVQHNASASSKEPSEHVEAIVRRLIYRNYAVEHPSQSDPTIFKRPLPSMELEDCIHLRRTSTITALSLNLEQVPQSHLNVVHDIMRLPCIERIELHGCFFNRVRKGWKAHNRWHIRNMKGNGQFLRFVYLDRQSTKMRQQILNPNHYEPTAALAFELIFVNAPKLKAFALQEDRCDDLALQIANDWLHNWLPNHHCLEHLLFAESYRNVDVRVDPLEIEWRWLGWTSFVGLKALALPIVPVIVLTVGGEKCEEILPPNLAFLQVQVVTLHLDPEEVVSDLPEPDWPRVRSNWRTAFENTLTLIVGWGLKKKPKLQRLTI